MPAFLISLFERLHLAPVLLVLLLVIVDQASPSIYLQGLYDLAPKGMFIRDLEHGAGGPADLAFRTVHDDVHRTSTLDDLESYAPPLVLERPDPGCTHLMVLCQTPLATKPETRLHATMEDLLRYEVSVSDDGGGSLRRLADAVVVMAFSHDKSALASSGHESQLLEYSAILAVRLEDSVDSRVRTIPGLPGDVRKGQQDQLLKKAAMRYNDAAYVGFNSDGARYLGKAVLEDRHLQVIVPGDSDRVFPRDSGGEGERGRSISKSVLAKKCAPQPPRKSRPYNVTMISGISKLQIPSVADRASRFFPDDKKYHMVVVPPNETANYYRNKALLLLMNVPKGRTYVLKEDAEVIGSFSLPLTRYSSTLMLLLAIGFGVAAGACAVGVGKTVPKILAHENRMSGKALWRSLAQAAGLLAGSAVLASYCIAVIATMTVSAGEDVGEITTFILRWAAIAVLLCGLLIAGVRSKRQLG